MRLINYLRDRMIERTTWASIAAAIVGAAALPLPFSYLMIGVGIVGTLVPSPAPKNGAN